MESFDSIKEKATNDTLHFKDYLRYENKIRDWLSYNDSHIADWNGDLNIPQMERIHRRLQQAHMTKEERHKDRLLEKQEQAQKEERINRYLAESERKQQEAEYAHDLELKQILKNIGCSDKLIMFGNHF